MSDTAVLSIPLDPDRQATLSVPFDLTAEEFEYLAQVVRLLLTHWNSTPPTSTADPAGEGVDG